MTEKLIIITISISALITFLLRALPFIIFHGNCSMPAWLERLGKVLPSAIMAVLTVYCLKDVIDGGMQAFASIIASIATAVLYKWQHNTFFGIAGGTVIYIVLLHVL